MRLLIENEIINALKNVWGGSGKPTCLKDVVEVIRRVPTVKELYIIRHGKWIVGDDYECSECECMSAEKTAYCPNCGAKMDKE